jgi:carboxymethylenebutenolidase
MVSMTFKWNRARANSTKYLQSLFMLFALALFIPCVMAQSKDSFTASAKQDSSNQPGAQSPAPAAPQEVVFPSGKLQLHGFLWKPEGPGPFPAIIWNHGSEKLPGSHATLAQFYLQHNYVFFEPHRRGQGRSPGDYIQDLVEQAPPPQRAQRMVELQDAEVDDVVAALNYLKSQTLVDPKQAIGRAKAPIFLLQAENDYSLGPSQELSKEALKKHADFQSKIYPAVGATHQEGHWKFCTAATGLWGPDVLNFLDSHMKSTP